MNRLNAKPPARQQGYILIMTMILIVLITMLALNQVSMNTTQTRVAANATNATVSFEKTEGAVNEAANNLLNGTYRTANFVKNGAGLFIFDPTVSPVWAANSWSSSNSITSTFQGSTSTKASYIIEQLPSVILPGQNIKTPTYIYRITATGGSGNTTQLIQSTIQLQ